MNFFNDFADDDNKDFLLDKFDFRDSEKIADILNDLWGFGKNLKHQKIADGFGKAYLFYCLFESSYAFTLKYKNVPIAFISWKENKNFCKKNLCGKITFFTKLKGIFKCIKYFIPILFCRDFSYQLKAWKAFFDGTKSLKEKLPHSYDAQLVLFISSKDFRGKGLGRKLFEFFAKTLEEHNLHSFFLQTDTECNYKFYDKIGLRKIESKQMSEKNGSMQEDWEIFIYGNEL